MLRDKKGGSNVTALLYILVAILAVYAAIKTVPPYMHYYGMEDEVRQQLHLSTINSEAVILDDLFKKAQELDIPLKPEDIKLTHNDDGSVSIYMTWNIDIDYGYGFRRLFNFEIKSSSREPEK